MNVERLRIKIEETIYEWADETRFAEATSPLRANSEQPVVGPPSALSEWETWLKGFHLREYDVLDMRFSLGWDAAVKAILQGLNNLDQGPVA